MTFTIHFGPWLWTVVALISGFIVLVIDEKKNGGGFLPMPGLLTFVGLGLWLSIPFVWLGWWLR